MFRYVRMYVRFGALLLLCCGALGNVAQGIQNNSAQNGTSLSSARQKEPAEITGHVTAKDSGAPLRHAIISAMNEQPNPQDIPDANNMTMTDADGGFTLKDLNPGRYRIVCMRNGYVAQAYGQTKSKHEGVSMTVAAGQKLKDIDFSLERAGVITGRITDEAGEPLAQAAVQAMRSVNIRGTRKFMTDGSGATDDRGQYRIYGLAPGHYLVQAMMADINIMKPGAEASALGSGKADFSYAPVYYPGSSTQAGAQELQIQPGSEIEADITVFPVRTYRVQGKVQDAGGIHNPGMVTLVERDALGDMQNVKEAQFTPQKNGEFEVRGVLPGSYRAMAMTFSANAIKAGTLDIDVGSADIKDMVIPLHEPQEISGQLHVPAGVKLKPGDIAVSLIASVELEMMGGTAAREIKDDHSFTIPNVFDEDYILKVYNSVQDLYVSEAHCGAVDLLNAPLRASCGRVELRLDNNSAQASGVLLDDDQKPMTGARIYLQPEKPSRYMAGEVQQTTTDQNGQYQFRGLRPGKYTAFAFAAQEGMEEADDSIPATSFDFLKPYADKGISVTLSANDQKKLDLKPIVLEKQQ